MDLDTIVRTALFKHVAADVFVAVEDVASAGARTGSQQVHTDVPSNLPFPLDSTDIVCAVSMEANGLLIDVNVTDAEDMVAGASDDVVARTVRTRTSNC